MTTALPTISDISSSQSFREMLRELTIGAFVELIPKEALDKMLDAEIKGFFESEQFLSLEQRRIEVENPQYNSSNYSSSRTLTKECIVTYSKMTPFRQMVWSALHENLKPKIAALLNAEKDQALSELDKWSLEQF